MSTRMSERQEQGNSHIVKSLRDTAEAASLKRQSQGSRRSVGVHDQQVMTNNMMAQQRYHSQPDKLFHYVRDESAAAVQDFLNAGGDLSVLGKRKAPEEDKDGASGSQGQGPSEEVLRTKRLRLLKDRGPVGELPLHMACLYDKPDTAIAIMREHVALQLPVAETFTAAPHIPLSVREHLDPSKGIQSPFEGENALHIAVAQGSHRIVHALLTEPPADEQDALLLGRATGPFFGPEGDHFFGELPLAFAVSLGRVDTLDRLLMDEERTRRLGLLRQADTWGNNLMHLCVKHNQPAMMDHLWRWHRDDMVWCLEQRDSDHMTPLMLAVRLGEARMVEWLEVQQRTTLWRFGETAQELVPLDELDPILIEGNEDDPFKHENSWSLLNDIDTYSHSALLLDGMVAWRLAEAKWEHFARDIFQARFVRVLLGLLVFLVSSFLDDYSSSFVQNACAVAAWPFHWLMGGGAGGGGAGGVEAGPVVGDVNGSHVDGSDLADANVVVAEAGGGACRAMSAQLLVLTASQLFMVGMSSKKLATELQEWYMCGVEQYWGCRGARFLENFVSVTACTFILLAHAAHVVLSALGCARSLWVVPMLHAGGALASWSYLSFFLLGSRQTGPFVVMLWEMLLNDITAYLCVFLAVLIAFSQAISTLVRPELRTIPKAFEHMLDLVHAMIGDTAQLEALATSQDVDGKALSELPRFVTFLVGGYILLATLMMFNTLVAAMTSTYEQCTEEAEKRWRLERCRIISSLESEMNATRVLQTAFWVETPDANGDLKRYLLDTSNVSHRRPVCPCECPRCKPLLSPGDFMTRPASACGHVVQR